MTSVPQSYVPCLRWKQGEYQAVLRSTQDILDFIVPLIEVAELGYDFEKRAACRSIDDHLAPLAKRIHDKLGIRPCFVDVTHIEPGERMEGGGHPATYVFSQLRDAAVPAIPTLDLRQDAALIEALKLAVQKGGHGACLRVRIEEVADAQCARRTRALLARVGCSPRECDLVVDLGAPSFTPVEGFTSLLEKLITRLPDLDNWRSFTVIGTSFPVTMAEVPRGISTVVRHEWIAYKRLIQKLKAKELRLPRFGDYGIAHPALVLKDMRFVKPNATVRYTVDDGWMVAKGQNVRDHSDDQYRELCRMVVNSGSFEGSSCSKGDKYIEDCAAGVASTGRLTTWRWVGTNHHLAKVVKDISSLGESSSSA